MTDLKILRYFTPSGSEFTAGWYLTDSNDGITRTGSVVATDDVAANRIIIDANTPSGAITGGGEADEFLIKSDAASVTIDDDAGANVIIFGADVIITSITSEEAGSPPATQYVITLDSGNTITVRITPTTTFQHLGDRTKAAPLTADAFLAAYGERDDGTGTNINGFTPTDQFAPAPTTGSELSGTIVEDAADPTVTGTFTVEDDDGTTPAIMQPSNLVGTYGSIAWVEGSTTNTGTWTYTLDNTKPETQALAQGQTATETFTFTVADDGGTEPVQIDVVITVTGVNDAPEIAMVDDGTGTGNLVAASIDDQTKEAGEAIDDIDLSDLFTDADADDILTLTFTVTLADGSTMTLQEIGLTHETQDQSGNPVSRITGTINGSGTYTIRVVASDNAGAESGALEFDIVVSRGELDIERSTFAYNIGEETVIDQSSLLVISPNEADLTKLVYTITELPSGGVLRNEGIQLDVNDTFTQADINNGVIRYIPPDGDTGRDETFTFTFTDDAGTSVIDVTLQITSREDFEDGSPDQDNAIDRSAEALPQKIEAGDGSDDIIGSPGNDQIDGGAGDDDITLTRDDSGNQVDAGVDEVIYTFGYDGVGIDGGDKITGFRRGQDKLTFVVKSDREGVADLASFLGSLNGEDDTDLTDDDAFIVTLQWGTDEAGDFYFDGVLLHFKEGTPFADGRVSSPTVQITFDERLNLNDLIEILGGAENVADNFDGGLMAFKNLDEVLPRLFGEGSIDFVVLPPDSVSVIDGAVLGAGVFFDLDGDGEITDVEKDAQRDESGRSRYITGEDGTVDIPEQYVGLAFIADVDGAYDIGTGERLEGTFRSLANGEGGVATPITDLIVTYLEEVEGMDSVPTTAQEVLDAIFGLMDGSGASVVEVADIFDMANYEVPEGGDVNAAKKNMIINAAIALTEIKENDDLADGDSNNPATKAEILTAVTTLVRNSGDASVADLKTVVEARVAEIVAVRTGKPIAAPDEVKIVGGVDYEFPDTSEALEELFGFLDLGLPGNNESFKGVYIKLSSDNNTVMIDNGTLLFVASDGTETEVTVSNAGTLGLGGSDGAPSETGYIYVTFDLLDELVLRPDSGFDGGLELVYHVWDGTNASSDANLVFKPNSPPVAGDDIEAQIGIVGEISTISLAGLFSDADGEVLDLTFTVMLDGEEIPQDALNSLAYNRITKILTIKLASSGTYTIIVEASDGDESARSSFSFEVALVAPTVPASGEVVITDTAAADTLIGLSGDFGDENVIDPNPNTAVTFSVGYTNTVITTVAEAFEANVEGVNYTHRLAILDVDDGDTNLGYVHYNENTGEWIVSPDETAVNALPADRNITFGFTTVITDDKGSTSSADWEVVFEGGDNKPSAITVELVDQFTGLNTNDSDVMIGVVAITDDGAGTNTIVLTGANVELFEIRNINEVWLKAGVDLSEEGAGLEVIVSVEGTGDGDNPASQTLNITVTVTEDHLPEIEGVGPSDNAGTVTEDDNSNNTATGTLRVTDADNPPASTLPSIELAGSTASSGTLTLAGKYGTISFVQASGVWTYMLDDSNAMVQALGVGDSLTDEIFTFNVGANTFDVTITVDGANDAPTREQATLDDQEGTVGQAILIDLSGAFEDVDGDVLTLTPVVTRNDGTDDIEVTPRAISYDEDSGILSVTLADVDSYKVTVMAMDDSSAAATETLTFNLNIVGQLITGSSSDTLVIEDDNTDNTATGTLSIIDDNDPQTTDPVIELVGDGVGTYGTMAFVASASGGTWTYTLDPVKSQALRAGVTDAAETFTFTAGGSSFDVVISATGVNDIPVTVPSFEEVAKTVQKGEEFAINLGEYFKDPEGDELSLSLDVTRGVSNKIRVSLEFIGLAYDEDTKMLTGMIDAADTYEIIITARETGVGGQNATSTLTIVVNATPEIDTAIEPQSGTVGQAITAIDLSSLFRDPDGGTLTLEIISVVLGDSAVPLANHGGLSLANDMITGMLAAKGEYIITVKATDSDGGEFETDVILRIDPVDSNDPVITNTPGASGLTVTEDGQTTATGTLSVSDADEPLELPAIVLVGGAIQSDGTVTRVGTYGTLTFNPDTGTWTYTLDNAKAQELGADDLVDDVFTFRADNTEQTVTIMVQGVNDLPTAGTAGVPTGTEGQVTMIDLSSAFEDVDDDLLDLTFVVTREGDEVTPSALSYDQDSGMLSITLADVGSYAVEVTATDDSGLAAVDTSTFDLNIVKQIITGSSSDTSVTEGNDDDNTATGTLSIIDGNPTTPAIVLVGGTATSGGFRFIGEGTYGTISFRVSTGVWTYRLDEDKAQALKAGVTEAAETFTFMAGSSIFNVIISATGVNNAPELVVEEDDTPVSIDDQSGTAGQAILIDLNGIFEDADDDLLGLTFVVMRGGSAVTPSALSYDQDSGILSITLADVGSYAVEVTATDDRDAVADDTSTFNLEVVEQIITGSSSDTSVTEGDNTDNTATGTLSIIDDNDPQTTDPAIELVGDGVGTYGTMVFVASASGGTWTYTLDPVKSQGLKAGVTGAAETFTFTAGDASFDVIISATGVNAAPEVGRAIGSQIGTIGQAIEVIDLSNLFTDVESDELTLTFTVGLADGSSGVLGDIGLMYTETTDPDTGVVTRVITGTVLGNLDAGTYTITAAASDGSMEEGTPNLATVERTFDIELVEQIITGPASGGVTARDDNAVEEEIRAASGTLALKDDADGDNVVEGTYGTITYDPVANTWSYVLDNESEATKKLKGAETDTEVFIFTAGDASFAVTITVTGVNEAPVARDDEEIMLKAFVPIKPLTLFSANPEVRPFTDPDGDTLVLTLEVTVKVAGQADRTVDVDLTDDRTFLSTLNYSVDSRIISGTLDVAGTYAFVFTATDGNGGEATFTRTYIIEEADNRPASVVRPVSPIQISDGVAITTIDLNEVFRDPDGDAQYFSASVVDEDGNETGAGGLEKPVREIGLTDNGNGFIGGTINAGPGTYYIKASAYDGGDFSPESTASQQISEHFFTITVGGTNNIPVAGTDISEQSGTAGQAITAIDLSGLFTDDDAGDTLTLSVLVELNGEVVANSGLELSNDNMLTGTLADVGTYTITVTATDGTGSAASSFEIIITAAGGASGASDETDPGAVLGNGIEGAVIGDETDTLGQILIGGDNAQTLNAGEGGDMIIGGRGEDTINLGAGADTVLYRYDGAEDTALTAHDGGDMINDFDVDEDTLILAEAGNESIYTDTAEFYDAIKGVSLIVDGDGNITGVVFTFAGQDGAGQDDATQEIDLTVNFEEDDFVTPSDIDLTAFEDAEDGERAITDGEETAAYEVIDAILGNSVELANFDDLGIELNPAETDII